MVEQKTLLTEAQQALALKVVRLRENAFESDARKSLEKIRKLSRRDNQLGNTFDNIFENIDIGFVRYWDKRITKELERLGTYFYSIDELSEMAEGGHYIGHKKIEDYRAEAEQVKAQLISNLWQGEGREKNGQRFRNSVMNRIQRGEYLAKIIGDMLSSR